MSAHCECEPGKGALQLAVNIGEECDRLIADALMTPAAKQRLMDTILDWGKPRR